MKFLPILALVTITCISSQSFAQVSVKSSPSPNIDRQVVEQELANIYAPIKSDQDLNNYLNTQREAPFDKLSPSARQGFLDSLVFTKKGLAGFRYDILEDGLTPTEIYPVLSLFGLQSATPQLAGAKIETSLDRSILALNSSGNGVDKSKNPGANYGVFGVTSRNTSKDDNFLRDFRCVSPGTCQVSENHACTSNC